MQAGQNFRHHNIIISAAPPEAETLIFANMNSRVFAFDLSRLHFIQRDPAENFSSHAGRKFALLKGFNSAPIYPEEMNS